MKLFPVTPDRIINLEYVVEALWINERDGNNKPYRRLQLLFVAPGRDTQASGKALFFSIDDGTEAQRLWAALKEICRDSAS